MTADEIVAERARLVDTLRAVGPDAASLAAGWRARDVAHHVVAGDRLWGVPAFVARRLVAATGMRLTEPMRQPRIAALVNGLPRSWERCLDRLDRPPPAAVLRRSVAAITLWEHVVHHEDVRRPSGAPRRSWPDLSAAISWLLVYNRSRLAGVALRVVATDGHEWSVGHGAAVAITGDPGELVLWLSGRAAACDVSVTGERSGVDVLARRLAI